MHILIKDVDLTFTKKEVQALIGMFNKGKELKTEDRFRIHIDHWIVDADPLENVILGKNNDKKS